MKPEDFICKQLVNRLDGHLDQDIIERQCDLMLIRYRKTGINMTVGKIKKHIVDAFYDMSKKSNKANWKN